MKDPNLLGWEVCEIASAGLCRLDGRIATPPARPVRAKLLRHAQPVAHVERPASGVL